jgi:HAD superfamily hydrolase (TIGR01509 family)
MGQIDPAPCQLKVVLLDVDGTLLDSNEAHALCWQAVLQRYGFVCSYDEVRPLIGMGGDKVLPQLTGLPEDNPLAARIAEERTKLFLEHYLPGLSATPGARALVEKIIAAGLRPVVATSASDELPALLKQAGIDDLIELSATSKDAERSKPDGDIVVAALRLAGVQGAEAVMIGDTPYDVEAAGKAGVDCIAFRCGGWWLDSALAPAHLYDDPAALLQGWGLSVLAR